MSEENKYVIEEIKEEIDTIKNILRNAVATGRVLASDINADIDWLKDREEFVLAEAQAKRLARVFEMLYYIKEVLNKLEVIKDLTEKAQGEGGDEP